MELLAHSTRIAGGEIHPWDSHRHAWRAEGCNASPFNNTLIFSSLFSTWRHWSCVSPERFGNMTKSFREGLELDGYGELRLEA